jgi:Mn2+/Fe2+ NRAMP family transporter
MLIITAAEAFRGRSLENVAEVAIGLRPLFGEAGTALFCLGLFSAAYSSFLVNSMIGGFILADGFGLGSRPEDPWTRRFTALILVIGMVVALLVIKLRVNPLPAIVMAQAVTVVASPLMAAALLWLTNRNDVMQGDRNRWPTNLAAAVALLLLLGIAYYTVVAKILPTLQG